MICEGFEVFVLEPVFHHTIWGGNRLESVYGKQAKSLGHLYSVRCMDENANMILNGKFAGRPLFDAIGTYPLSIALVDAASDLSIQVHPRGSSKEKHESYYFIDAPNSGHIYCGMKQLSDKEILDSFHSDKLLSFINQAPINRGDYVNIKPGTVHALTAGSFVYEIEQGKDNTYRLYDYGRTDQAGRQRDLHINDAIEAMDAKQTSTAYPYQSGTVIREKTYATQLLSNITRISNIEKICKCLTLMDGEIAADGIELKMGMSVILEPNEVLEHINIRKAMLAWSI